MKKEHNSNQAIRLPIFIGAAMALGIFIGAQMAGGDGKNPELYQSLYKLRQVITYIDNDYVDEVDTETLVESAIEDMLVKLDPHTVYIPAEQLTLAQSQLEGNFEGIGIEFNIFRDTVHVVAPLSGGPSEKLGLQPGDKIVEVDGENIAGIGITNRGVITRLRGPKGSEVNVKILRSGGDNLLMEYTIERDVIPQYSVDVSYMVDHEIGYIKVSRFAATTYLEFKEALFRLKEQGMKKLILDLTGNPGGYMDRAVDMVDEFIAGKKLIVYTQGKETRYNDRHISRIDGEFEDGPLIILIDEGSASASEIVSGAIQDHDRGLIVGRRSYGKGLVQLPMSLNDGSELRLTISRYYTPSGRCIQKPYNGNVMDYHAEYMDRFRNGEVYHEDSVTFNDSLAFRTTKGRVVFGGGGIIPDYFVPFDTTGNSRLFNRLFNTNSVAEYALNYAQENLEYLEAMTRPEFVKSFEVDDEMVDDLIALAMENNVDMDRMDLRKSKDRIKLFTKALIGRRIWDNEGFYPVLHQEDEIVQKALQLFDEAEKLAQ